MFRNVNALTRLSAYRDKTQISEDLWTRLLRATYGRAILITEINEHILRGYFNPTQQDVAAFKVLSNMIRVDLNAEKEVKGRHIPLAVPQDPQVSQG